MIEEEAASFLEKDNEYIICRGKIYGYKCDLPLLYHSISAPLMTYMKWSIFARGTENKKYCIISINSPVTCHARTTRISNSAMRFGFRF